MITKYPSRVDRILDPKTLLFKIRDELDSTSFTAEEVHAEFGTTLGTARIEATFKKIIEDGWIEPISRSSYCVTESGAAVEPDGTPETPLEELQEE